MWVMLAEGLLTAVKSPLVPLKRPGVLALVPKYDCHLADSGESFWVMPTEGLLIAAKSPQEPPSRVIIMTSK